MRARYFFERGLFEHLSSRLANIKLRKRRLERRFKKGARDSLVRKTFVERFEKKADKAVRAPLASFLNRPRSGAWR